MGILDEILGSQNSALAAPGALGASQQVNNQNIAQQAQMAQTANQQNDLQTKQRQMQISMLNGLLNLPPDQFESAKANIVPIANKINPSYQIDPNIDPATIKALAMSQVPASDLPTYQMNQAKANFYNRLAGGGQPSMGGTQASPQTMPDQGQPQGSPTSNSILSDPNTAAALSIFDPAGATALANVQKLQYESPQGKQATAEAEKTGANVAETGKTLNIMQANLPVVLQRFKEMSDASKDASYGFGVEGDGSGFKQKFANQFSNIEAQPNTILEQRAAQGILPELGPQLAQAGIKGNKFLEGLASSASGLNLGAPPPAKEAAINGLREAYINNLKSTARQARAYGDKSAPTDDQIDAMVSQYDKNPGNAIAPTATTQAKGMLKGASQNIPIVKSQADFNALPSGAVYIESDGNKYRKP